MPNYLSIDSIKDFPGVNFKELTLTNDSQTTYFKFKINIGAQYKPKKDLRVKIFLIANNEVLTKLKNSKTIQEMDSIINSYSYIGPFANPRYFIDKNVSNMKLDGEGNIDVKLSIPSLDFKFNNNVLVGAVFYYDPVEYSAVNKIPLDQINSKLLSSGLISNSYEYQKTQDKRAVTAIVNNKVDILNALSLLDKQTTEQIEFEQVIKNKKWNKYFSDIFYTLNSRNDLSSMFLFDEQKFHEDNKINLLNDKQYTIQDIKIIVKQYVESIGKLKLIGNQTVNTRKETLIKNAYVCNKVSIKPNIFYEYSVNFNIVNNDLDFINNVLDFINGQINLITVKKEQDLNIDEFVKYMNQLGYLPKTKNIVEYLTNSLTNMLKKESISEENILFVKKIYEKFLSQVVKLRGGIKYKEYITNVNYVFKKKYYLENSTTYYNFLNISDNIFPIINVSNYKSLVTRQINKYINNINLLKDSKLYHHSFLPIYNLIQDGAVYNLNNTDQFPDFEKLEKLIRIFKNQLKTNKYSSYISEEQYLFDAHQNLYAPSQFNTWDDDKLQKTGESYIKNLKTIPGNFKLLLDRPEVDSTTKFTNPVNYNYSNKPIPVYFEAIFKNVDNILNLYKLGTDYLTGERKAIKISDILLYNISEYSFLFSSIHRIEYLEYNNGPEWKLLTDDYLNKLKDPVICRLVHHNDSVFATELYEYIKSPVLNDHFILTPT